ncbi:MAG TPA: phosphoribosylformylglycinamidine cyclo-ligase [Actinomycetota bacterium]|nr:phosphoribosylformylglycinamidine cyclo-ligase [Actinomycetota bacterium]
MSRAYRRAGVDLEAAERAVELISQIAARATRPEVVAGVGGFAGLYRIGEGRLLAAAADGVGTKAEIARQAGWLDTVGIDVVAMGANDVVCTGAEPLFFLDYLACGRLVPEEVAALVRGVAEGCREAGCALLGGETAEHPGVMEEGRFDLAGFCVGVVAEDDLLGPHRVREGDLLLGLPSSGLHSNGFSLVRRALEEAGVNLEAAPPEVGRPLADELLEPTRIYVRPVLEAAREGLVQAAAHVTGGGLPGNLTRILPPGLGAHLDPGGWQIPPIFRFIQRLADADEQDIWLTLNMGLGLLLVVRPKAAETCASTLRASGVEASVVGRVEAGEGVTID